MKQFDLFLCTEAELYRIRNTLYLWYQLANPNPIRWLAVYNPSDSYYLPSFGKVEPFLARLTIHAD